MAPRSASRVVVATAHDSAYRAALDLKTAGVGRRADCRLCAPRPKDRWRRPREPRASRSLPAPRSSAPTVACGSTRFASSILGRERKVACDALLMSGGWTPSVHLFSQSRGKLVFDEALQLFKPGASAQRERSVGACNATFDLAGALVEGDAAGRAAASAAGFTAPEARAYAVTGDLPSIQRRACRPAGHSHGPSREGVRRFPERRLRQGCEPGGPGGHALDRAHQALHDHRHGDRPGQAFEHERARDRLGPAQEADPRGGTHHLPPTLHAGDLRRLRRPCARRPVRSHPAHAHSRLGGRKRRRVRGRGPMETRLVFSARSRNDARRGRARVCHDARKRRPVRRHHARQDRSRGSRCGDVSRTHVRQRLPEARGRALSLWPHAERGRFPHG